MTELGDASLTLAEVQERFDVSTTALDEVQGQLRRLSELAARRTTAVEGLEKASSELAALASAASEAVAGLRDAQASAVEAFRSMQSLVDGTELRDIRTGVQRIDERATATDSAVAALAARLEDLRAQLDDRDALRAERDKALEDQRVLEEQHQRLKQAAGGRAIRRAGLGD